MLEYNNYDYSIPIFEKIPETHPLYEDARIELSKIRDDKTTSENLHSLIDNKLIDFTSYIDPVTEVKTIVSKGLEVEFINIDKIINVEPRFYSTNFVLVPYIVFGFENSDWIFFDKIYFNIDGNKYSIDVAYSEQNTQVHDNGNISEWTIIPMEGNNNLSIDAFKKIAESKDAIIKFSGKGYIDHVITDSEKQNLKKAIELYEIISKNKLESYLYQK